MAGKFSPLNPRVVRISIFFFALLLESTINALLHDKHEEPGQFELTLSKFWEATYAFIISSIVMHLISSFCAFSQRTFQKMKHSSSEEHILEIYKHYRPTLLICRVLATLFVVSVSFFFILYLVAFGNQIDPNVAWNWLGITIITILEDQLIFELLPAILVGTMALGLIQKHRGRKCCLYLICTLGQLRSYRNLVR